MILNNNLQNLSFFTKENTVVTQNKYLHRNTKNLQICNYETSNF